MVQSKEDICATVEAWIVIRANPKNEIMKSDTKTAMVANKAATLEHGKPSWLTWQQKLLDCWTNVKTWRGDHVGTTSTLIGVSEGKEISGSLWPRGFAAQLLTNLLPLEQKPLINYCHRSPLLRPTKREPSRPLAPRRHYNHEVEDILQKATDLKNLHQLPMHCLSINSVDLFPGF